MPTSQKLLIFLTLVLKFFPTPDSIFKSNKTNASKIDIIITADKRHIHENKARIES